MIKKMMQSHQNLLAGIISISILVIAVNGLLFAPVIGAPKKYAPIPVTPWNADIINADTVHDVVDGPTGDGVYVAVLDSGLSPNWKEYFPKEKIATKLGKGFFTPMHVDPKTGEVVAEDVVRPCSWIGSTETTHGTHVTSTIIGYRFYSGLDIEGIAPGATIIPIKVLKTYHLPPLTGPGTNYPFGITWGSDAAVAAGIDYATDLAIEGYMPLIITMSLGGDEPSDLIEEAIDRAIANGVVVVVAAGNSGDAGMDWPGAYPQVISVGAAGWIQEWLTPAWWASDVPDPTVAGTVYVTDFSGREKAGQELDVLAPGSWVVGPMPGWPGYNHNPWWSHDNTPPWAPASFNFYYAGGTSMAAPHVTGVAAMMLEIDDTLDQGMIEFYLKGSALPIPLGSASIFDPFTGAFVPMSWGSDATGAGLVLADSAIASIP